MKSMSVTLAVILLSMTLIGCVGSTSNVQIRTKGDLPINNGNAFWLDVVSLSDEDFIALNMNTSPNPQADITAKEWFREESGHLKDLWNHVQARRKSVRTRVIAGNEHYVKEINVPTPDSASMWDGEDVQSGIMVLANFEDPQPGRDKLWFRKGMFGCDIEAICVYKNAIEPCKRKEPDNQN